MFEYDHSKISDRSHASEGLGDRDTLLRLPLEERKGRLLSFLIEISARALRIPAGRVKPTQSLTAFGLDSLAAAELSQEVKSALDVDLSFDDLLDGCSIEELVDQFLVQLGGGQSDAAQAAAEAPDTGEDCPLSHSQRALWFLDRLEPGNPAYVIAGAVRIEGDLDTAALRNAFHELFLRHPALRTTFGDRSGEPWQMVSPLPAEGWFLEGDLSAVPAREMAGFLAEVAYLPFDLERGPLLRVGVFRTGPAEHRLVLSVHHLVADLWSIGILVGELAALLAGRPLLPPPAVTYVEHVRRERLRLARPEGERAWSYWREQLAEAPAVLELPADRPRPPVQTFRGGARSVRWRPGLSDRVAELAIGAGATPFMVLLAGWAALLERWSGQENLLIGTPTAGRSNAEFGGVVGYFVNSLVLRVDLSGGVTFRELVGRVRGTALSAYANQDFPFALLTERLVPARDPSRSPLFQVMFALQQAPLTGAEALSALALGVEGVPLSLGSLAAESAALGRPGAQLDLSLFLARIEGDLAACLEFNSDLWDAVTAERLLLHLETLLAGAVADPATRLADLPLLTAVEAHQLLHEWNDTAEAASPAACLHELFEAQAARTPEAEALVCGTDSVTYRELERRANQLARHLRSMGVGPEVPVGVAMTRTPALVESILAVLKAGGAYVPLDLAYPAERIAYTLRDSGAPLVLVRGREGLPADVLGGAAAVDVDGEAIRRQDGRRLAPAADPDNLAYLIYTSGSTGRPKGVAIRHASAVTLVRWASSVFPAEDLSGLLAATSICFDLSVFELFLPLATGGRVILAESALELPSLDAAGVTLLNTVPSVLGELLRGHGLPRSLRTVNLAGEPLPRGLVEEIFRCAPWIRRVLNLYGPSEDTTYSTWGEAVPGDATEPGIGRPLAATRAYVVDGGFRLAAPGRPGELVLGGAGLARGYLGRPDLTAASFVPDPFSGEPGTRLYRTGDLARHRADGTLHFLGRRDHQVKVRGFRIELGEIEAALSSHPEVAECAVAARGEGAERRLVAWWVPRQDPGPSPRDLRLFLGGRLPEHMVPTAWVSLPSLPKTTSGKIDRKTLPDPAAGERSAGQEPRTPAEEVVAGIWAQVLELERVGCEESFFDLGGHSLLATRVAARVRQALGVDIPLRTLFAAPTVRALAAAAERARAAGWGSPLAPLSPEPRGELAPVSPAQERMWFLERFEPGPVYNLPAAVRLEGELEVAALAVALAEIVRRHEVLRTTFLEGPEGVLQRVAPAPAPFLPVVDLSGLPPASREAAGRRLAAEEARRPFDLAAGPLLRTLLLRLGGEDHTLLLSLHHIVADGWSLGVFARELGVLYGACRAGRPSPLPEPPLQYADYALWQRRWLAGEEPAAALRFWTAALAGLPVFELPADRPRPPAQSFRGGGRRILLPPALAGELLGLCRDEGATLFIVLLAGLAALLSRLTGQEDLPVGTPVANRTRPELEGLVGLFVNTLVLRADASGDPSFGELLGRLRETCLAAYDHQDLPFEKLVEVLRPERDPSRTPLFQVMFALENERSDRLELPGLTAQAVAVEAGIAKFDLTLSAVETPDGGIAVRAEFARDLFDSSSVDRLLSHLEVLLTGVVAGPGRRLSQLPLLSEAEREQILVEWNDTRPAVEERCLHELIAGQAARTPDAVAVVFEGAQLSYGELDRRAGALARRLRALGGGPEVRVGLCAERSLDLVVGLLGILKSGSAYVPLDPGYPDARLSILVEDSGASVLLVQAPLRERLWRLAGEPARLVELDEAWPDWEAEGDPLDGGVGPENAAYVIFTSGSTGRPKGAVNTHRAIVNRLLWMQRAYGLTPEDRVLQKTPFSFDVSVWELFWPLLTGARLVVARPGGHQDGGYLVRTIGDEGVTHVHFVPSMLRAFLEEPALERCSGLRRVIASGEALPVDLARQFHGRLGRPWGVELHNLYGPTEAAVDVTYHACRPGEERVPIGRPVDGTSIHLLDTAGGLAPVGVAGELCIGGVQVARGYLGRPDLTAERFVPNPFGEPGSRLYRTGDLARRLPDGEVEYLGRLDHQVKIRGFRIELGEIEAALEQHPSVREAVVLAREGVGGLRLVAWWVPEKGSAAAPADLRDHLRQRLPEHMVPSAWMDLDRLPLTPNGKIDRKALPDPVAGERSAGQEPRTPAEEIVAGIWAQVLELERVGCEESFFDLGGHSLLATRVTARVREALGVDIPLRTLFAAPTVRALAAAAERARAAGGGLPLAPLSPEPRGELAPVSPAQERMWFLERFEPGPVYNLPVAVRLEGELEVAALAAALAEIVRRHEALRTMFLDGPEGVLQRVAPAPAPFLPVVDLSGLPPASREATCRRLAAEEARRPFDLAAGPLLRTALLRLGREDYTLLLCLHHIAADGWSLGVFARELGLLYGACRAGRPSPLPELPLQYADYALWQRRWLAGDGPAAALQFWTAALADLPALELPTDRPRPPVQSSRGGGRRILLPPVLAGEMVGLARGEGATLFMVLLSGLAALLGRLTRQEDLPVGTPVANRTRPELEGLVGLFVNTLVLRADASGDPSFAGLLGRLRETCLAAYSHQDLPFEKLVEVLRPERDPSRTPLFQVMLSLQNDRSDRIELPGLAAQAVAAEAGIAKFDLTLTVREGPEAGLAVEAEFARDLFDSTSVDRLLGHLEALLAEAVAGPRQRLSYLPVLSAAQAHQVLCEWNPPAPAAGELVPELFARQAARTPLAPAVVAPGQTLTYGELALQAGRLARRLRASGAGPESVAGLYVERSPELAVGVLGTLAAGAAFLPLDPDLPPARVAEMLTAAGAATLVTSGPVAKVAAGLCGSLPLLRLDAVQEDPEPAAGPIPAAVDADNAAYTIFTSGSTGGPKGVVVSHRALAAYARDLAEVLGIGPGDRVLQFASPGFDVSIEEMLGAWLGGAALVLRPAGEIATPAGLLRVVQEEGVTVLDLPTAFWHEWVAELEAAGAEPPAGLRLVVIGGEAVQPERLATWRRWRRPLLHGYGLTEATVTSTLYALPEDGAARGGTNLSIGRPLPATRLYLLGPRLEPLPIGARGEIAVGGACLARSYCGRADLTAERFVPDPFGPTPGARLYRTGDLGRLLPDGNLEFLGRVDRQLKLRGFRVEPGEVEAVLVRHPAVREVAVESQKGPGGDLRLVAYVAPAVPGELRRYLEERLPRYMVPAAFVGLSALPRMPNGKVDRRALPVPEPAAGRTSVAPGTPVEELLAGIWAEVLGADGIGVEDDFFELGGHSLLAARVVSRIRQALGVELPVRTLFEAPTVAGLAARLEAALRPEPVEALLPVPRGGELPLSAAQERLWFLAQLDPASPTYNIPAGLHLRGRLDAAALEGALAAVLARHESLRTTFGEGEGGPFQSVAPVAAWTLPLVDLAGLAAAEAEVLRLAREEAVRPFDLARGPLFRAALLRLGPADHLLLLDLHHAIADGWSLDLLTREVGELYAALLAGREAALPPLPVQYADYAAWQRRWLAGENFAAKLARAKDRLAGAPLHLELPGDRPRPAVQSLAGAVVSLPLEPALAAGLRRVGRRSEATLFMTLLAGFAALLARHTGETDLLVGTPVANRDRVEIEGLIGLFVNTLVLRCDLAGDPGAAELLRRVRGAALDAYSSQDVPFERLVAELSRERNLGQNPLVQVMFGLLAPAERLRLFGVEVALVDLPTGTAKLDLSLTVLDHGEELTLSLEHSTELFDAATARRWLERYRTLLAGMVESVEDRRLADLPLLPEAERSQLTWEWNDTARPVPQVTIHELFTAQAARTPAARAVSCAGQFLTYAGLEQRVHRLARHLRRLGIGRGDLVGLCLERSLDMVAAVLGVLEAGGAYVPLDPSYPRERLAMMLEDARPPVLLTEGPLVASALPAHGARLVLLDDPAERERIAAADGGPPDPVAGPEDLAYVLFTSGSTGRPKGVQIPHGAAVSFLLSVKERPGLAAGDRLLAVTSLSFDIAGLDLFLPLAVGAEVEIAPREVASDGLRLLERVTAGGITALQATPATWKLLLEAGWQGGENLLVLCGGEAMPPALAAELLARSPRVWNFYGPTESTIWSTAHPLVAGTPGPVPLGRPIANTRIHLLGRSLEPVPAGATGELYIGGAGLSWGYRSRPDLTAERFLPDPLGAEPGARLYRTGDFARVRPDGTLAFLGRADQQVKVRGHRIELGEIEAALGRHREVAAAAAALRPGPAGEAQLVAWVVFRPEAAAGPDELRRFLRERLPEPMLPATFVALPAFPLTPNGKVDRKALPAPAVRARQGTATPRTEAERRIAEIWREVLGMEPDLHDNFFDLGGHSLLLLRAHRRLQAAFGKEVPLTEMFRHPTVASLGELLARGDRGERSLEKSFARAAMKREVRAQRPDLARRGGR